MNKQAAIIGIIFLPLILAGCITGAKQYKEKVERDVSNTYKMKPPIQIYCDHKGSTPQLTKNILGGTSEICVFEDKSECLQLDFLLTAE